MTPEQRVMGKHFSVLPVTPEFASRLSIELTKLGDNKLYKYALGRKGELVKLMTSPAGVMGLLEFHGDPVGPYPGIIRWWWPLELMVLGEYLEGAKIKHTALDLFQRGEIDESGLGTNYTFTPAEDEDKDVDTCEICGLDADPLFETEDEEGDPITVCGPCADKLAKDHGEPEERETLRKAEPRVRQVPGILGHYAPNPHENYPPTANCPYCDALILATTFEALKRGEAVCPYCEMGPHICRWCRKGLLYRHRTPGRTEIRCMKCGNTQEDPR